MFITFELKAVAFISETRSRTSYAPSARSAYTFWHMNMAYRPHLSYVQAFTK
jgi:hypothetical protein